jgi:hypothetical protein
MAAWEQMQKHNAELSKLYLEHIAATAKAQAQAAAAQNTGGGNGGLKEIIGLVRDLNGLSNDLRGPEPEKTGPRLHIHNLADGSKIVENKHGDIDATTTAVLNLKDAIGSRVASRIRGGGGGAASDAAAQIGAPKRKQ